LIFFSFDRDLCLDYLVFRMVQYNSWPTKN
jgi:hypothetical protein